MRGGANIIPKALCVGFYTITHNTIICIFPKLDRFSIWGDENIRWEYGKKGVRSTFKGLLSQGRCWGGWREKGNGK